MATTATERRKISLAPNRLDQLLAAGSAVLMAFVVMAIVEGRTDWLRVPPIVWAHIITILLALGLTPVMLLRRRGDRIHRRLGWIWASAMALTALLSFGIRGINSGGFSPIHFLSALTLMLVPVIVISARRHQHAQHRGAVRGMVSGALLIAGFFTFAPDRLLGGWLFG
jgi:uncharacterized membrane protein